ncbi:MAG: dTDP-4-dehydrorhamnose reductase [Fimbriimonadaceae bacterium]|nr:dTDP-4-dehydrorhamnose reductase [Fimbriimonadaceae bacterium]
MENPLAVVLVGASGMLGQDVAREFEARGYRVEAPTPTQLDLRNPESVAQIATGRWKGTWCVNCAAYTQVDRAEQETDLAMELNALAPSYLARACTLAGMRLLHVSTDFVFDGRSSVPYDEDAPTHPLGVYGRSKRLGEEAVLAADPRHLVVRTAWLYGTGGHSFPKAILRAWLGGKSLRVVADQIGSPTSTVDLARVLADLLERDPEGGVLHAVGPEELSWHQFAVLTVAAYAKMLQQREVEVAIEPIESSEWPTAAPRPAYSVLSTEKLIELGIAPMRPVRESLEEFCRRLAATMQVG